MEVLLYFPTRPYGSWKLNSRLQQLSHLTFIFGLLVSWVYGMKSVNEHCNRAFSKNSKNCNGTRNGGVCSLLTCRADFLSLVHLLWIRTTHEASLLATSDVFFQCSKWKEIQVDKSSRKLNSAMWHVQFLQVFASVDFCGILFMSGELWARAGWKVTLMHVSALMSTVPCWSLWLSDLCSDGPVLLSGWVFR